MKTAVASPQEYIDALPEDRKEAFLALRAAIVSNLPKGFTEEISYGMIGYVVPHSLYPAGYHCNTKLPLPFISIAAQKNFVALYHMGLYADENLMEWLITEYSKNNSKKLDIGKSCIRFKKLEDIPQELIGELLAKTTPQEWIRLYEKTFIHNKK